MTLARLRTITRQELSWRAAAAARIAAQRAAVRLREPRWDRAHIARALSDDTLDDALRSAIARRDWPAVAARLVETIGARPARFALDPASAGEVRDAVLARWPELASRSAFRANRVLRGEYDVLGYRGLSWTTDSGIDWHLDPVHGRRAPRLFWADVPYLDPAIGDHKIIWELNRHQHWLVLGRALWLTGDARYARAILEQLDSWLAANPPLMGVNWASMLELGLRAISWTWGLHFLLGDPGAGVGDRGDAGADSHHPRSPIPDPRSPIWIIDLLVGLDRQLTHVEQHLSYYFSPNTHLTGEALALYVVGLALPELRGSRRRAETGRRILLAEIDRQILPDGGHAERSTHYQRYTLDFYLFALLAARRAEDHDAAGRFADAATRLAAFTRTIAGDDGRLPLIGDDDGGMLWPIAGRECADVRDSLALAAVVLDRPDLAPWGVPEEVFWIGGRTAIDRAPLVDGAGSVPPPPSRVHTDTGYVVLRDAAGGHAVLDAGPHGYMNGGHAHADALSLTLGIAGRMLLVDPGTSTYTMDRALRDHLRSSVSHNTVTIGGRSPAIPSGPFHWKTRADARLEGWRHNAGFDWAEASHDGYAPVRHRRTLLRAASGWLIVDDVLGEGMQDAAAHWHFDPAWMLSVDGAGRIRGRHMEGDTVWMLHDGTEASLVHGGEAGLGWYAPTYGTLVPTWTVRAAREATAPFTVITWFGSAAEDDPPTLERLEPVCDHGGGATAARVVRGHHTSVFLVRPGEPAARDARGCEIGAYQTDARVLHWLEHDGALAGLDVVDAGHALALRDGWLSVSSEAHIGDLHLTLGDGVLDLHASAPAAHLRIEGDALEGVRTVRLNRREHVPRRGDREPIAIAGGDWAVARPPHVPSLLST